MRILVIARHSHQVGGVEAYLGSVVRMLVGNGHLIRVVTEEPVPPGGVDWLASCGMDALRVDDPNLMQQVSEFRPDVIFNNQVANVALEERILSIGPSVLFVHTHHGTCISGRKMHAMPRAMPCTRVLGVACLALYLPRRCGGLSPARAIRDYKIQRRRGMLLRTYPRIVVASDYMRDELGRAGIQHGRVAVLPYFVDTALSQKVWRPRPSRTATLRLLVMSRLTDIKGGLVLFNALQEVRRYLTRPLELVIAGDGPLRVLMEQAAGRSGIPCSFLGWISEEQKYETLVNSDLLVVPSIWPEPFGIVGIEAAITGVPAVAFDVGGIREWLDSGETGELAPGDPPTSSGLAAAIVRAARDARHLEYLGEQARLRAERFLPGKHLQGLERVLEEAVRDGRVS